MYFVHSLARSRVRFHAVILCLPLAFVVGCATRGIDCALYGSVWLDDKPVEKAVVQFISMNGRGRSTSVDVNAGTFEVRGLEPGTFDCTMRIVYPDQLFSHSSAPSSSPRPTEGTPSLSNSDGRAAGIMPRSYSVNVVTTPGRRQFDLRFSSKQ